MCKRAATVDAGRIDGIEPIGRLEIDRSSIVVLRSAAKSGRYILNLRGHPASKKEEVRLSFEGSFK